MDLQAQLRARRERLEAKRNEEEQKKRAEEIIQRETNDEQNENPPENSPSKTEIETWECKYCSHKCDMAVLKCILCGGLKNGSQMELDDSNSQPQRVKLTEKQRRKFEQKWLADSDSDSESDDSDYRRQFGVRRPDDARFDVLVGEDEDSPVRRRRRRDSSDDDEPLVRPLNGDASHLFNFYERKPPQDLATRTKLSTYFQIQLRKNQPRFKPALSPHEWQLLRNVDIDTDQPRTLIFTLGYSQDRICKALESILDCSDAVNAIAEFAETATTFRVLNQEGRNSRISFFDECTLSIGNERITPTKLERQPFVEMLFTNFPILCGCYPWDGILKVIFHCTQWEGHSSGIFPSDLDIPPHFDSLTQVTNKFEALTRRLIRTACEEHDVTFPMKRSNAIKVLTDVVNSLEDNHRELVIQGLSTNKMIGRKAVVAEGIVESRVKNETELVEVILTIKTNPSWVLPTIETAYRDHVQRRKRAVEESFLNPPKKKRKTKKKKKAFKKG